MFKVITSKNKNYPTSKEWDFFLPSQERFVKNETKGSFEGLL